MSLFSLYLVPVRTLFNLSTLSSHGALIVRISGYGVLTLIKQWKSYKIEIFLFGQFSSCVFLKIFLNEHISSFPFYVGSGGLW